ncbi:hypothetical protein BKA70DRAFT_1413277 [Coprinopsis sp. MPI-PUGE-AT-0042]|nr:hypothetical protein BKA70DRAFT_1413277 [Coprinopsis sp. MPI-PUGE-AT-0042]
MMDHDSTLHSYANSNDPLPDHLLEPLARFLDRIDVEWDLYERDRRCGIEAIDSRLSMIEVLEREIEALTRAEMRAFKCQEILRTKERCYASSVTAFRRVPPEVVAIIIGFAIHGSDGLVHQEDRLFFSQIRSVCRLWREVSFSTPSLWRAVGIDLDQLTNRFDSIQAYIPKILTPWFLRAGEGAPLTLQFYGALSRNASAVINFMSTCGFNITTLAFSTPANKRSMLSYNDFTKVIQSVGRPLPIENLTFEFHRSPRLQPPSRELVNLTKNFPKLANLSLQESTLPQYRFPFKTTHESLARLQLVKLFLSFEEVHAILYGLPRLQILDLQCCEADSVNTPYPSFKHPALETLFISDTIPESMFGGLTCPALRSVEIGGIPSSTFYFSGVGRILGQFFQRCGQIEHFHFHKKWPAEVLENIMNSNTVLPAVCVDVFSSFMASPRVWRRLIKIPPSVVIIGIAQKATESQLRDFCDIFTPLEKQTLAVHLPDCAPYTTSFFPWPRLWNEPDYVLCRTLSDLGNRSSWIY